MKVRKFAALAIVLIGLTSAVALGANDRSNHTMLLTFSRPVSLPGVTLGSGTYIFEIPEPVAAHNVVRVLSKDRRIVYYTAFTDSVDRPDKLPLDQRITFAETAMNQPSVIKVWWPDNMSGGRQFIYPSK